MRTRAVLESFWEAMQANDWRRAADHFAAKAVIEWPCTGERIRDPDAWAQIQERYPAAGRWVFDIHRLVIDGDTAVTEFTVTDGERPARAIAISEVAGDAIERQVEYWTVAYEPAEWRADLVDRIDPVP